MKNLKFFLQKLLSSPVARKVFQKAASLTDIDLSLLEDVDLIEVLDNIKEYEVSSFCQSTPKTFFIETISAGIVEIFSIGSRGTEVLQD